MDRFSRYTLLRQFPSQHAGPVRDAIIEMLMPFKSRTLTITFDNGLEFSKHEDFGKVLAADIYAPTLIIRGNVDSMRTPMVL